MKIKKSKKNILSHRHSSLQSVAVAEKSAAWELSDRDIKKRMRRINQDFNRAFKLLRNHQDTVTFFGSARYPENNPYYKQARELARRISRELQLTIVTGGGPGIMEAANRGAHEACKLSDHVHDTDRQTFVCGNSIAMTIVLPKEQVSNPYVSHSADFYYFFSRKVSLAYSARAYVYFPGGFGTLDEFFEILTLKQTGKIPNIPIILCGEEYWKPLLTFIDETVYGHAKGINKHDMTLYKLTDNNDEILDIISKSKPYPLKKTLEK